VLLRESEQSKRIALLQNAERELFAKGETIRNLEEEITEIQLEAEIIKKRLEALDPAFNKF
jgi:acyl-[acyl carrier protein]--UDP-N-acetylglucosamine O-acyltransferase